MEDTTPTDQDEQGSDPPDVPEGIRAVVEEYEDRPSECTLYPVSVADRDERLSSWITARGNAFVPLEAVR